jgi:flavin-dependent dehydrogenase
MEKVAEVRLDFDVVVIGASSAGLFAAELLAKTGREVAVVERTSEIDPEERTYIITPGLYRVMPDIPAEIISQEIDCIQLQSQQAQVDIKLSSPDLIIDRTDLIPVLVSRAKSAGVTILTSCEFIGFEIKQGETLVRVEKEGSQRLLSTNFLIGADGVTSAVRKKAVLDPVPSVPLLQAEVELPEGWDPKTTKVWFDVEDTPYFYWLIPRNEHQAVVGLIAEQGDDVQGLLNEFLAKYDFKPVSFQAGQAAMHAQNITSKFLVGDLPVLLVGDAAGQVKVTTVGGTVTGFGGAIDVVRTILGTKPQKGRMRVKKELDLHLLIRRLLDQMAPGDYASLIKLLTSPVMSFLSRHDRDSMRSHFWKLTIIQPGFIPFGIKLLTRSIFSPKG